MSNKNRAKQQLRQARQQISKLKADAAEVVKLKERNHILAGELYKAETKLERFGYVHRDPGTPVWCVQMALSDMEVRHAVGLRREEVCHHVAETLMHKLEGHLGLKVRVRYPARDELEVQP